MMEKMRCFVDSESCPFPSQLKTRHKFFQQIITINPALRKKSMEKTIREEI